MLLVLNVINGPPHVLFLTALVNLSKVFSYFMDMHRDVLIMLLGVAIYALKNSPIMLQILLFYASVMLWIQPNYAS